MVIPLSIQTLVQQKLSKQFAFPNTAVFSSIGGGSINDTYRISLTGQNVFCKINSATKFPRLFEKEKKGLECLGKQDLVKVPGVIDVFESKDCQVLLLEWVEEGERTESFWKKFGEQLAALHQTSADQFGFDENNYMGSVVQTNQRTESWAAFFTHQRLQPLIFQCHEKKLITPKHISQFEKLFARVSSIFNNDQKPSLLHGDLWSGNFMCNKNSEPVLIDPAVYFGHPSVDLGMTTLFGGFRQGFYEAYNYHSLFPENYEEQWKVCNLYPLLIHLFLFGRSYLPQIEHTLDLFS